MLRRTRRGNFIYEPDGVVLGDFFWDRSRFACIQGPIGSGTSSASCHKVWYLACDQNPDHDGVRRTRWLIVRDTYKNLRETTMKTWLDWFPEDAWGPLIRSEPAFHHIARPHPSSDGTTVHCEVIFLAIPDPDVAANVLASYEITGFFLNEGQFLAKEVVDELLSRCARYPSMKNGSGATWWGGWMDMNAPTEGHWVPYMRGDIPLPPEMPEDEKGAYSKPPGWRFFTQPPGLLETFESGGHVYKRNPAAENQKYLRESYLGKIQGKKKSWIDSRVLNKVGLYMHGKPVHPAFVDSEHTHSRDVEPAGGVPIVCGLDGGRDPAAAFLQCVSGDWSCLTELIGNNESAALFAPRVRRHVALHYPGFRVEFWADPRMLDRTQASEVTAGDVFRNYDMLLMPATSNNDPETRRSIVETVLTRRNGLRFNPSCGNARRAFAGGYHYRAIKGAPGMYAPRPVKNASSHIAEAVENALIGGGEGHAMVTNPSVPRPRRSPVVARDIRLGPRAGRRWGRGRIQTPRP